MSMGERLRAARKAKNWTQSQLAEASRVKQGSISQIERGDQQNSIHIVALAIALDVTAEWLSGNPENKASAGVADAEGHYNSHPVKAPDQIPIVGNAQAGPEGYWDDLGHLQHGDGFIIASSKDPDAYALRVRGDSMAPTIKNGWFVVIEPNSPVHQGEYVVACTTDGLCMIKELRYTHDDEYTFGSINDQHPAMTVQKINVTRLQPVTLIVSPSKRQV